MRASLMRSALSVLAVAGLALSSVAAAPAEMPAAPAEMPAAQSAGYGQIVEKTAPSIVTIKFILKGEDESEEETSGVIIDGSGLVLASNLAFGGIMARFGNAPAPTNIKVMVGDDTEGVEAKLIARDSELGLAWIKVDKAPATPYTAISLSDAAEPKVGDPLVMVSLMGKYFDREPMLSDGYVSSIVTKPRRLVMPSVGIVAGGELGLPVFDSAGKLVGVTTVILPEREEMDSGNMREAMKGFLGSMILPAAEVKAATDRALAAAPEKAEEAAETAPVEGR